MRVISKKNLGRELDTTLCSLDAIFSPTMHQFFHAYHGHYKTEDHGMELKIILKRWCYRSFWIYLPAWRMESKSQLSGACFSFLNYVDGLFGWA